MSFIPKADWQWVYDREEGDLSVIDKENSTQLVYGANMLRLRESQTLSFTIEDVSRYIELFESASLSHFDEPLRCKIILHLLAIDLFHKPIMPKSWLFQTADSSSLVYTQGDLVALCATDLPEFADYMVIEQQGDFCLCMLLDEQHLLSSNKSLKQFQIVKVTLDKLSIRPLLQENEWISFQNAG